MGKIITLDQLNQGQAGIIKKVEGKGALRRRLVDMGFTSGAGIEMVKVSPLGDPVEYRLRGYHLSLRRSEAKTIQVELMEEYLPHKHRRIFHGPTQPLLRCKSGHRVLISRTRGGRKLRKRMEDLGLIPGTEIYVVSNEIPGPMIISINDESRLTLGKGMARRILVRPV
jgi:ferrous iron transport protein A